MFSFGYCEYCHLSWFLPHPTTETKISLLLSFLSQVRYEFWFPCRHAWKHRQGNGNFCWSRIWRSSRGEMVSFSKKQIELTKNPSFLPPFFPPFFSFSPPPVPASSPITIILYYTHYNYSLARLSLFPFFFPFLNIFSVLAESVWVIKWCKRCVMVFYRL